MYTNRRGAAEPQPGGKGTTKDTKDTKKKTDKGLRPNEFPAKSSREATMWEDSSTNKNRRK